MKISPKVLVLTAAGLAAILPAAVFAQDGSFTVPLKEFKKAQNSECSTKYKGCTGEIVTLLHEVAGTITVIDDCTFRVSNWEFDGNGPLVAWWAATAEGDPEEFPYPANAK